MSYTKMIYLDEVEDLLKTLEQSIEEDNIPVDLKSRLEEVLHVLDSTIKNDLATIYSLDIRDMKKGDVLIAV